MESFKRALVTIAVLAVALMRSASSEEDAPAALVEFHIPSQPLAQALNAWAQQCGLQLIWPAGGEVARVSSRALYGKYEPMQALTLLLENSGLRYSVLKEGTVTLGASTAERSTTLPVEQPDQ